MEVTSTIETRRVWAAVQWQVSDTERGFCHRLVNLATGEASAWVGYEILSRLKVAGRDIYCGTKFLEGYLPAETIFIVEPL